MPRPDITQYATPETRAKGARAANEARREKAKTEAQRLQEDYEKRRAEIVKSQLDKAAEGSVQHWTAVHDRIYGTPAKAEPETIELDIGSSEARGVGLSDLVSASRNGDEPVSQAPDNTADNA